MLKAQITLIQIHSIQKLKHINSRQNLRKFPALRKLPKKGIP